MPSTARRAPDRHDRPQLVPITEAAAFLSVDVRTIRRMMHRGQLRAYRVGNGHRLRVDMRQVFELAEPVPPESVSP